LINIIWITTQFPSSKTDTKGSFIYRTVRELAKHYPITVFCLYSIVPPIIPMMKDIKNAAKIIKVWRIKFPKHPQAPEDLNARVVYVKYFRLPRGIFQYLEGWFGYWAIKKYLSGVAKENTLVHATWLFPEGDLANIIHKKFKIPFLVTLMGSDVHYINKNTRKWRKAKSIIQNASMITSVSQALYESLEKKGILVPFEKRIITHTIYEFENFIIKDRNQIKSLLGLEKDTKIIFYAGTLRKIKNIDVLIEAFSLLIKTESNTILLIAGTGEEEGKLKSQILKNNLFNSVKLLGGLNSKEIINYYNAANIFCIPSQNEGTPNVVIESLLCGTAVVASKVGETPYLIVDGKNGYLVEPGSVSSLKVKLLEALSNQWDRNELRKSILHLSPQNVLKEYKKVYDSFFN